MNQRIKQIELQAAYATIDPINPFTPEEFNKFVEKFAKLLVLECASMAYKTFDNGDEIAALLMNTFGVEE